MSPLRLTPVILALTAVVACAKPDSQSENPPAQPTIGAAPSDPMVEIVSPAEGDSVPQPFAVQLRATGVEVVPATGVREEGKGHHHLVVDGDVPGDSLPLPKPPLVIHLGSGVSEQKFDSLSPGPHRIIAVFAYGDHVAMRSVRRDTVTVIVK